MLFASLTLTHCGFDLCGLTKQKHLFFRNTLEAEELKLPTVQPPAPVTFIHVPASPDKHLRPAMEVIH